MPRRSPNRVPLKFFGEARKTVRSQFAAARTSARMAASAGEAGNASAAVRKSAQTTLMGFFRIHLQYLADHLEIGAVLYDEAAAPPGERARQEHRKLMLFLLAEFGKIVAAGKKSKEIRGDVDPAMAAIHGLGTIQMAWTFWTSGGRKSDLVAAGLNLFDQLWEGIKV